MKTRNSAFELLRIISMLFIIFSHLINHGCGNMDSSIIGNNVFYYLFDMAGYIGVGLFFMISGYFLSDKSEVRTPIKAFFTIIFYGAILFVFCLLKCLISKDFQIGLNELALIVSPSFSSSWWFATYYLLLVIMSPGINQLLKKLNKWQFVVVLFVVLIVLYGFDGYLLKTNHLLFRSVFFYLLGTFIKRFVNLNEIKFRFIYLIIFFVFYLLCDSYQIVPSLLNITNNTIIDALEGFCILIIVPITCVSLFIFIATLKLDNNKYVNSIAACTFGIYLLHDNLFRKIIWVDLFHIDDLYRNHKLFPLIGIGIVLAIFVVGTVVDLLRNLLFVTIESAIKRNKSITTTADS